MAVLASPGNRISGFLHPSIEVTHTFDVPAEYCFSIYITTCYRVIRNTGALRPLPRSGSSVPKIDRAWQHSNGLYRLHMHRTCCIIPFPTCMQMAHRTTLITLALFAGLSRRCTTVFSYSIPSYYVHRCRRNIIILSRI